MNNFTLSVIMPALNEEVNIESAIVSTLKSLKNHNIEGEIIVVNDGSTDNTKVIIERLIQAKNPLTLINHIKPKGIGYSFFEGAKKSNKDIVVMFPGDNENDPDDALVFINLMNHVDILVPFVHNIEIRNRWRRLISSIYRFIINMSFGVHLNYTNGTVFYRRAILEDVNLRSSGFFYQAELLIKLIRKGYLFAEVPNFLSKRQNGKSKAISFKSLFKVSKSYIKLFVDIHILRVEAYKNWSRFNKNSISFIKYQTIYSSEKKTN